MGKLLTHHGMRVIALRAALRAMLEEVAVCQKEVGGEEGEILTKLIEKISNLEFYIDEFSKKRENFSDEGY